MEFVSKSNLKSKFEDLLDNSNSLDIAMAYFNPESEIIEGMKKLDNLNLLVGDDFRINNPNKLEKLNTVSNFRIRKYNPKISKLHSKVCIFNTPNEKFCLLGSANLTNKGLNKNEEANVLINSSTSPNFIEEVQDWFDTKMDESLAINFETAKRIHQNSKTSFSRVSAEIKEKNPSKDNNVWILKTRSGRNGEDQWNNFLAESVISIGWSVSKNLNSNISGEKLKREIIRDRGTTKRNAEKVIKFKEEMGPGDYVVIIQGYPPTQKEDVYIYGIAIVDNDRKFYIDNDSDWWKHKRDAKLEIIQEEIPIDIMKEVFDLNSCLEALHGPFDLETYEKFLEEINEILDVNIDL